ncbi:MAG TPA: DUF2279 domain-containing protein [Thermoanaerobaculia bacterium]|nr:DUF2279 domain-containing protein [Thermoanaerobaculia bacterium]
MRFEGAVKRIGLLTLPLLLLTHPITGEERSAAAEQKMDAPCIAALASAHEETEPLDVPIPSLGIDPSILAPARETAIVLATPAEAVSAPPPAPEEPKRVWAWVISGTAVLGSAANSFTDGPNERFHFTNKNGFGSLRFAGGADLVSHFVDYNIVAKEFTIIYAKLGYSEPHARILASSVTWFTSLVTEIGDGRGHYGFNYEDVVAGTLGIGVAALISANDANDLVGFRIGYLYPKANLCCPGVGRGRTYSNEIYTGDLKIVGLARRLHFNAGPARYLYFSVTYGTKGYPEAYVPLREKQVGFEIGINFGQIVRDLGLPEDSWVGIATYLFLDNFRIIYTQIGFYYDINHGRWHGPGVGNQYGFP